MKYLSLILTLLLAPLSVPPQAALDLQVDLDALSTHDTTPVTPLASSGNFAFTPLKHQKLARELERQLRRGNALVHIPEVETYIQDLGKRLAAVSGYSPSSFHFFVLNSDEVNAFAGFGGIIGVNKGLILRAQSESELASVIAHEIAHVSLRHLDRTMEAMSSPRNLIAQALMLALAIAAGSQDAELGIAAATTAQGIAAQHQINYTRLHEQEADKTGIKILSAAGFNPSGMTQFMKRMLQMQRFSANSIPAYLQTHPLAAERVAWAQQKVRELPVQGTTNTTAFNTIRMMLAAKPHGNTPAATINRALGTIKRGKITQALQAVRGIQSQDPYLNLYLGQVYQQAGQLETARTLYNKAYQITPSNIAANKRLIEVLSQMRQYKQADAIANAAIRYHPNYPEFYRLKARLSLAQGKQVDSYLWQAQYDFYNGNTRNAIQHLMTARQLARNDFFTASRIDAKIVEYQALMGGNRQKKSPKH
jgi:beta-barrel assembly-enhancing protease